MWLLVTEFWDSLFLETQNLIFFRQVYDKTISIIFIKTYVYTG